MIYFHWQWYEFNILSVRDLNNILFEIIRILCLEIRCSTLCIWKAVVIFQSSGCAFDPLLVHFEVLRAIENKFIYGECNNLFPLYFLKRFVPINIIIVVCFSTFFDSIDASRTKEVVAGPKWYLDFDTPSKKFIFPLLCIVIYGFKHKNVNHGWYFDSVKKMPQVKLYFLAIYHKLLSWNCKILNASTYLKWSRRR